eukprot:5264208-Pyramimonas_sp.AAC.1
MGPRVWVPLRRGPFALGPEAALVSWAKLDIAVAEFSRIFLLPQPFWPGLSACACNRELQSGVAFA